MINLFWKKAIAPQNYVRSVYR